MYVREDASIMGLIGENKRGEGGMWTGLAKSPSGLHVDWDWDGLGRDGLDLAGW